MWLCLRVYGTRLNDFLPAVIRQPRAKSRWDRCRMPITASSAAASTDNGILAYLDFRFVPSSR